MIGFDPATRAHTIRTPIGDIVIVNKTETTVSVKKSDDKLEITIENPLLTQRLIGNGRHKEELW